ncbi:MAG: T9SS type A sorting domain-containing protein [Bacteroidota bacterium]
MRPLGSLPVYPLLLLILLLPARSAAQTYLGTDVCKYCHAIHTVGGTQYDRWAQSLHAKILLPPDSLSVRPWRGFAEGDSISMGPGYGNAKVYIRKTGSLFVVQVGTGGSTYAIARTNGWAYTQRYLARIDTSYYILPIQYNLPAYLDNPTYDPSNWVPYNPSSWFNTDGTTRSVRTNVFRATSWDKNCMGCHVSGGRVMKVVNGLDTSWSLSMEGVYRGADMAVGCEMCHGPYQLGAWPGHQMNPAKLPTKDAKLEVCAQCHSRGQSRGGAHEYPRDEATDTYFNPADRNRPLSQFFDLSRPPSTVGGAATWPDLVTARMNHQQYQEMIGSGHYNNPNEEITCFTCHTSHDTTPNKHAIVDSLEVPLISGGNLRLKVNDEDNTLCLACHAGKGPFASIPKSWIQNEPAKRDSIGRVVKRHTRHDKYDPLNLGRTGGIGRCTVCHMTKSAAVTGGYELRTHTFNVIPPTKTLRYASVPKGMLNTCAASCHRNPSGPTADVEDLGVGIDPNLEDWTEPTDISLAEKLWREWEDWGFSGVRQVAGEIPGSFDLSQNYPNPFNPSTRITVALPHEEEVRLIVYDVLGREVTRLMDGVYAGGRYEVTWKGRDDLGFLSPSGVYIYRLQAGTSFTGTRKMLLLK